MKGFGTSRRRGLTGAQPSESLERAGLTANKNVVPGDTQPLSVTSGLRFGVSAGTARGLGTAEYEAIGHLIAGILDGLSKNVNDMEKLERRTREEVRRLTREFPIYGAVKESG